MNKKNIYLAILLLATFVVTLLLAKVYKIETQKLSYAFENINRITAEEYDEYMLEHPDAIIYIADKTNLKYNKKEKSFVKKINNLNLLEFVIYIDKEEMNKKLEKKLKENYSYEYDAEKLPAIIVINDGEISQISYIDITTDISTVIEYGAFE